MSDQAGKANRRWIIVPWGLFIAAVLGWSGYWMIGARQIGERMDEQAKDLRNVGYTLNWSKRSVKGYPFRFFIRLDQAQILEPEGWGVSAPRLEAEASALTPGVVVLAAPQGVVLARPDKPALTVNGDVLRMSLSGLGKPTPKIRVEGRNLRLIPASGDKIAFSAIDRFEARLTPGDFDEAKVFLRLDKATPAGDTNLSRIAGGDSVTVSVGATVRHANGFTGGSWKTAVIGWLGGGGVVHIDDGGLALGDKPLISLEPCILGADTNGYLDGRLALSTDDAANAVLALGEIAVLPHDTAAVAAGLAPLAAAISTSVHAKITLHFHDEQTWLGPAALGPAPRVFRQDAAAAGG